MFLKRSKWKKRTTKGKNKFGAKAVLYDNIKFRSGLEKSMYVLLKEAGLEFGYETHKFKLQDSFIYSGLTIERQANGKGDFYNRSGKIQAITYTPDFVGSDFIIETKGVPDASFPMKWKMFKKHLFDNGLNYDLYKPHTIGECKKVVSAILKKKRGDDRFRE